MRDDVKLQARQISAEGVIGDSFLESIFFAGNGRMGVRGYPSYRPQARPAETGLFIAGMFDEWKPGITDIVNLPTPFWHEISIDGGVPELIGDISYALDMFSGLLSIGYTLRANGKSLRVTEERLFPFRKPAVTFQRTTFSADSDMALGVVSGVELSCCNQPIPDDQVKENLETIKMVSLSPAVFGANKVRVSGSTRKTGIDFSYSVGFRSEDFAAVSEVFRENDSAGIEFGLKAEKNRHYHLNKTVNITTGRDVDPRICSGDENCAWEEALRESELDWGAYWENNGIEIAGDDDADAALRFSMFQLRCGCSARDNTVSIGARGLTHTRYKGCYFWDTDFFMLPYYLLTDTDAARSLVQYRINTLPQAKEHARRMNASGARYPWMVSYDGSEQCETWDIGGSEVHVTADIAYAVGRYLEYTDDRELFYGGGAELLIETARFWVSRYTPSPNGGGVNLLWCKGPDEYCGITSNNLFTNRMAQHNLSLAADAADTLLKTDTEQYTALGLSESEVKSWKTLRDKIPLPRDPETGNFRTDDTFHLLESVNLSELKDGDEASYHKVCFDRLQRYKVVKQADVLLLMSRFPDEFTAEEKLAAWNDFEPLCLHDSTLSFASHALFAFQNGLISEGERYLSKALLLDLRDIMGNTGKEGLHLANMGESWQAVVFGIAGMHIKNGGLETNPSLPSKWKAMKLRARYRDGCHDAAAGYFRWELGSSGL